MDLDDYFEIINDANEIVGNIKMNDIKMHDINLHRKNIINNYSDVIEYQNDLYTYLESKYSKLNKKFNNISHEITNKQHMIIKCDIDDFYNKHKNSINNLMSVYNSNGFIEIEYNNKIKNDYMYLYNICKIFKQQ